MSTSKKKNQYNAEGKQEGYWEYYNFNGNLNYKGNYANGKKEGYWECYWEYYWYDGQLVLEAFYVNI